MYMIQVWSAFVIFNHLIIDSAHVLLQMGWINLEPDGDASGTTIKYFYVGKMTPFI